MRLLLFSNSTNAGEEYLSYTLPHIKEFKGKTNIKALFIPYAAISISFDEYAGLVAAKLQTVGVSVTSIHRVENAIEAIESCEMIIVGGGNTFNLLKMIKEQKLDDAMRSKVLEGIPYIGWSAGSNLTCPTIRTTNDMPVVEPPDFNALNLIPFQINPHYSDYQPPNHAGETREMRINEFLVANEGIYVAGLREGTFLRLEGDRLSLVGDKPCRIFKSGTEAKELTSEQDFSFLLQ